MKKQIKLNWQTIAFAAIVSLVIVFAGSSPATAQTTYKVGERVEAMTAGAWLEAEILEVKGNGYYVLRYIESGLEAWQGANYMRPIKAAAQTNNRNNADNQVQNQRDGNNRADNRTAEQKPGANRFEARDPRICKDTKAPARGAITAALALKYLNCQMEYVSRNDLYLVENVKVEVGGGIPYAAIIGHRSFSEIDVKHPVYPIRGSLLRYQCQDPKTAYVGPPNTNCTTYNEPKAKGYCYKTTFGDWRCYMSDTSDIKENYRRGVAPPKP